LEILFDYEDGGDMFLRNFEIFAELRGITTHKDVFLKLLMNMDMNGSIEGLLYGEKYVPPKRR
jgi:hypothetical protein